MMRFLLILSIFQLFASVISAQTDSLRTYMRNLVVKYQNGSLTEEELNDLRAFGYALQNKAVQLAESNQNDLEALYAADSALQFWISIGETGHEANVSKLKGTLLGKQGKTEDARLCLLRSVSLYESLKMGNGVAAAYYEMSVVLDQAGMTDSALWYQQQAAAYWLKQKETLKVVESNNQLIHLYRKLKRYEEGIKRAHG
jgi:tetratricopeptide (TPR) repeat protein